MFDRSPERSRREVVAELHFWGAAGRRRPQSSRPTLRGWPAPARRIRIDGPSGRCRLHDARIVACTYRVVRNASTVVSLYVSPLCNVVDGKAL
jgi:hypothetical protein